MTLPGESSESSASAPAAEPYFTLDGDVFHPNDPSRGPWNRETLAGRAISGILGYAVEQRHGDDGFVPARLTVDMFRVAPYRPMEVTTRVVREAGRIKVVDAELICEGLTVARASCQFLRKTENPQAKIWGPPGWTATKPEDLPEPVLPPGAPEALRAIRMISGQMFMAVQRRAWMREVRDFTQTAPLTPFMRAALAADFASPFSNHGDAGLEFINTDVTLYLHRAPEGAWLGMEVVDHNAAAGVSVGSCRLYDAQGPIGTCTAAALAQRGLAKPPQPTNKS